MAKKDSKNKNKTSVTSKKKSTKVSAKPKPNAKAKTAKTTKKTAAKKETKATKKTLTKKAGSKATKPKTAVSEKAKVKTKTKTKTKTSSSATKKSVSKAKTTSKAKTEAKKTPVKKISVVSQTSVVDIKPETKQSTIIVSEKKLAKPIEKKKPEIKIPLVNNKPINLEPKEKMKLKRELLAKCIEIQQNIVATAKKAMDEAQQSANEEKNSNEEMTDSFRETMQATRDVYARQVQEGLNTLGLLNRIVIQPLDVVKFGAVVITDFQNYFISAGVGEIKMDEANFVTVSTLSPLYQILADKKKGDIFMFLDRKYRILDVF